MRVLILGSSGFIGRHVARECAARGHTVEGWSRKPRGGGNGLVERAVDLLDPRACQDLRSSFDAALLLAGASVPGENFDAAAAENNALIARHALTHLANFSQSARVIVMSSAHVYGSSGDAETIDESRTLSPNGLYGASKLAVERIAHEFESDLDSVIVRSFNQIGPDMPRGLLVPDLLAALTSGTGPVMMRGSDGVRDFLDVRDGARALTDLLEARVARGTVLNLCSGRGVSISSLAADLARGLGIERPIRFAGRSPLPFVGNRTALTRATGFVPEIPLATTVEWIAGSENPRKR
ncbi:MAG: NAD(P)-dependent oxidoreductase [Planctomycetes bacterium]|nr:NAD(P)-dependent oxidoreductase [Planctomycetota bacterium]